MKVVGYLPLCLALGCAAGSLPNLDKVQPVLPQRVNWVTKEQASGLSKNRPVFIYIRNDYCGFCDLEDQVLNDPEVVSELNRHYISVKLNTPVPSVRFVPTISILETKESDFEMLRVEHFVGKTWLLAMLRLIDVQHL